MMLEKIKTVITLASMMPPIVRMYYWLSNKKIIK